MKNSRKRVAARRRVALNNLKKVSKPDPRQKKEMEILGERIKDESSYYVGRSSKSVTQSDGTVVAEKPKRRYSIVTKTKGRVKLSSGKRQTKPGKPRKKWTITGETTITSSRPMHLLKQEYASKSTKGTQVTIRLLHDQGSW